MALTLSFYETKGALAMTQVQMTSFDIFLTAPFIDLLYIYIIFILYLYCTFLCCCVQGMELILAFLLMYHFYPI